MSVTNLRAAENTAGKALKVGRKRAPIKLKPGQLCTRKKGVLNLPATGGYMGGCAVGTAMAIALLKRMRADEPGLAFLQMQYMITEFMKCMELEGGHMAYDRPITERTAAQDSRRGQYAGFFQTLSHWMEAAVREMGSGLDCTSEEELLAQTSSGLNFDQEAYFNKSDGAA
jgi:hypothetical protein